MATNKKQIYSFIMLMPFPIPQWRMEEITFKVPKIKNIIWKNVRFMVYEDGNLNVEFVEN